MPLEHPVYDALPVGMVPLPLLLMVAAILDEVHVSDCPLLLKLSLVTPELAGEVPLGLTVMAPAFEANATREQHAMSPMSMLRRCCDM